MIFVPFFSHQDVVVLCSVLEFLLMPLEKDPFQTTTKFDVVLYENIRRFLGLVLRSNFVVQIDSVVQITSLCYF